ncbi:hypothetical protein VOLCADRAFT_98563 [Volvox carteri f. nagariensis]|uniref:Uncharacterized protein n=1 Tax=Volvox carteri f. nagariensis TaxID=3068 RepID=D8UFP1_VOLCA|nr:uncharacterized protein VOLCADRAFT_98563 [Volvox carteri f. nagariensis]EFJ41535.1 hypothetical protein VOLCADRAFT_98563 [Volvox carteri f. nagariensis]|eukprot:XP_002957480.1 hypothetical protein VOLCADRAFT_98563 [Volvox carteri f. nagariensis]
MALFHELQAAEPPSPDAATTEAGASRSTRATRGSAGPPAAPQFACVGPAPQAAALAQAPSQQSSQMFFSSRGYGLYGLYEHNGMQEQLITGYYTPMPALSPRSYRDSPLQLPNPHTSTAWQRINTATGTHVQLRNLFLRNVFALLALSLGAAAGGGLAVLVAPPEVSRRMLLNQPWVLHLTLVLALGTLLLMALSERLRRPHPRSLLAFAVFSAGQVLVVATATAALGTCIVVQAVALAALALACVAACAQLLGRMADLTAGSGIAWCCAGVVLGWAGGAALEAVVAGSASGSGLRRCSWVGHAAGGAAAAAAAFSMYAVVDVLMLLYGRHAYAVHSDEHVFAALGVYLDPLNLALFGLHRLQLFLMRRGRGPGDGSDSEVGLTD